MIGKINFHIPELDSMKKYPNTIEYIGDTSLLNKQKISIVGSRKPNQYAREITHQLSLKLSQANICIVSGGAIGIDAIAHKAASPKNTIMVAGTGLDKRYPAINKNLIADIEKEGLILSQFKQGTPSQKYNFPLRNELLVALGDILIVMYADENSGTMRSIEYAKKMGKDIYVIPHRLNESTATNKLLSNGDAKLITDLDIFVKNISNTNDIPTNNTKKDPFIEFCKTNPNYEDALKKFPSKLFEAELSGKIYIKNAKVYLLN